MVRDSPIPDTHSLYPPCQLSGQIIKLANSGELPKIAQFMSAPVHQVTKGASESVDSPPQVRLVK